MNKNHFFDNFSKHWSSLVVRLEIRLILFIRLKDLNVSNLMLGKNLSVIKIYL